MSAGENTKQGELAPPPGFEIIRASSLDPIFGSFRQWAYRGTVDGVAAQGSGYCSPEDACRAAWGVLRG